jgi:spore coat polysaccharide biosynthesis protein SpsF
VNALSSPGLQASRPDILVVVQCRFASARLPGKALLPLAGTPMLVFLLRRLKAAGLAARLVLATTQAPQDDPVAAWGLSEGLDVVRGETDDVLARFLRCLRLFPAAGAVRVTADNPLTDTRAVAATIQALRSGQWDYVNAIEGWIPGTGVDGLSRQTLEDLDRLDLTPLEREHINARILARPEAYRRLDLAPPPGLEAGAPSLTVDTAQDYETVRAAVEAGTLPPPLKEPVPCA